MSIEADIEKDLGKFHLAVHLRAGEETLALLGASGCGKTMTLKCIAGVEKPDQGRIVVNGRVLFDGAKGVDLSPQKRRCGLLFQNYALFPQMTVLENIMAGAGGAAEKAISRSTKKRAAADMMERMGLTALASHYPRQLSGGQQQRTALARMLVSGPEILLLDEPFSALDPHLRFRMEQEVGDLLKACGKTAILVSHNREEAYRLADRIAIMGNGKIEAAGRKEDLYLSPETKNGALLTGCQNLSPAVPMGGTKLKAADWGLELVTAASEAQAAAADHVGIRAEDIRLAENDEAAENNEAAENCFICAVKREIEEPDHWMLLLQPQGGREGAGLACRVSKPLWTLQRKPEVRICIPPAAVMALREPEQRNK